MQPSFSQTPWPGKKPADWSVSEPLDRNLYLSLTTTTSPCPPELLAAPAARVSVAEARGGVGGGRIGGNLKSPPQCGPHLRLLGLLQRSREMLERRAAQEDKNWWWW